MVISDDLMGLAGKVSQASKLLSPFVEAEVAARVR